MQFNATVGVAHLLSGLSFLNPPIRSDASGSLFTPLMQLRKAGDTL